MARIIIFLLGAILFISPLLVLPGFFFNFTSIKTFFFIGITEIAALLYLWLCIFNPEYRPKKDLIFWGFLGFLAVSIVSGAVGVYPTLSFWSAMERADGIILLIHVFLFFLIFTGTVKSRNALNKLLLISLVSAALVALSIYIGPGGIGLYKTFFGSPQAGGLIGNDSFAGTYFIFNLFFAGYLFFENAAKKFRWFYGALFAFILFSPTFFNFAIFKGAVSFGALVRHPSMLLGTARGAAIGLALGAVFSALLFASIRVKRRPIRISLRVLTGVFLCSLFVIIALIFSPGTSLHSWFGKETLGYRYIYWHQAIESFKERPILGAGPDTFQIVSAKYFDPAVLASPGGGSGEPWTDKPHGIIFDVLESTGVIGMVAYLFLFSAFIWVLWRSKRIPYYAKALFSGLLLAYVLQNLILFDVLVSYMMLATLFGIATILSRGFDEVPANSPLRKMSSAARNTLAFLFFLIGIFSLRYFAIQPLREVHNRYELSNFAPQVRAARYAEIRDISPFGGSIDEAYTGDLVYLAYIYNLNTILKQKDLSPFILEVDSVIADVKGTFGSHGKTYRGVLDLSHLYNLRYMLAQKNDPATLEEMRTYGKTAVDISPTNPQGYWAYAQPFIYEKNYAQALSILEQGLTLNPSFSDSHRIIINLVRLMNDPALLQKDIARAQADIPGFQP